MKVNIKSEQKLEYMTKGACAFDFKSNDDYIIKPGEFKLIETGTTIKVPEGYCLKLYPRSSTYKRLGLIMVNSVGIIDNDYCGNNDTIKCAYINMSDQEVNISKGNRIAQGVFTKIEKVEFNYVEDMGEENRGGFGTTGI